MFCEQLTVICTITEMEEISMKTKEELSALREEVETLSKKLADLNEEELKQIGGGLAPGRRYWPSRADAAEELSIADR